MQTKREEKGYFTSEINVEKKSESATWSVLGENLEGKMVKVAEIAGDNHKAKGHFPNGDNLKTRQTMNVL